MTATAPGRTSRRLLGEMLRDEGRIDEGQLLIAMGHKKHWGCRIGAALVAMGYVTEQEMLRALARQLAVPYVEIGERSVPADILKLVPVKLIRAHRVLPLTTVGARGPLVVAANDPGNLTMLDEVAFGSGMAVRPVLAGELDLERAIARHLDGAQPGAHRAVDLPADPGPMPVVDWRH